MIDSVPWTSKLGAEDEYGIKELESGERGVLALGGTRQDQTRLNRRLKSLCSQLSTHVSYLDVE
jgi:hypothetical protein